MATESTKRDEIIAANARELDNQNQRIHALMQNSDLLAQTIDNLMSAINSKTERIGELTRSLDAQAHELEALATVVEVAKKQMSDVEASWSWRLSKPLRILGRVASARPKEPRKQ